MPDNSLPIRQMTFAFYAGEKHHSLDNVDVVLLGGQGRFATDVRDEWMYQDHLAATVGEPRKGGYDQEVPVWIFRTEALRPDCSNGEWLDIRIEADGLIIGRLSEVDAERFLQLAGLLRLSEMLLVAKAKIQGGKLIDGHGTRYAAKLDIDWLAPFVREGDTSGQTIKLKA